MEKCEETKFLIVLSLLTLLGACSSTNKDDVPSDEPEPADSSPTPEPDPE